MDFLGRIKGVMYIKKEYLLEIKEKAAVQE
jgi:hypothetical protein